MVVAGTLGLLGTLAANLGGCIWAAVHGSSPAFPQSFDQRYLVLMAWGFMVPFVWGFSARWLPTFLGIRTPCNRGLMIVLALNFAGVMAALLGAFRVAVILLLAPPCYRISRCGFRPDLFSRPRRRVFTPPSRTSSAWLMVGLLWQPCWACGQPSQLILMASGAHRATL